MLGKKSVPRNLRRAVALLCLMGAFTVVGLTAGPGLAQGPSPERLAEQGWTCFVPPVAGSACGASTRLRAGRRSRRLGRTVVRRTRPWPGTPAGEFQGHVHLIRPDLYAGQPCAQTGALYVFSPRIGYYECNRFF